MYRIFGSENSPYSIKVRAYFRYKGIPHEWIVRNASSQGEFQKYAKLAIVPTVATPDGKGLQDSTPIMEVIEQHVTEPSVHPSEPALRFIDDLLEEFGDEWGNKWMFHYRWAREVDQRAVSLRLAKEMSGADAGPQLDQMTEMIKQRMSGRGFAVGSNEKTAPLIEESFKDAIVLLDRHLSSRPFLLGRRPSMADFGIAPQLFQALIDPTGGEILRTRAPRVVDWCERMLKPVACGDFEPWTSLRETLEPFLSSQVQMFLKWSAANAEAVTSGAAELKVDLGSGRQWQQTVGGPQKYHVKSLTELRRKRSVLGQQIELDAVLERCGCKTALVQQAKL